MKYFNWLKKAKDRAEELLQDNTALRNLLEKVKSKLKEGPEALNEVIDDLRTMIKIVKAWMQGEYNPGYENLLLIVAALVYLVWPIDAIPDFLPGGFIDDAAVLGFVIKQIRSEIDHFRSLMA